jgi:flavin reductase (DIM6/NTAB) family NADH-FMN oxidoreductase RutF
VFRRGGIVDKVELSAQDLTPVRPIFIVGADVNGKPNFMNVGGGGSVSFNPPMVALPIQPHRYTLKGILENRTLSVNIPLVTLVKEADYTGIMSGAQTDKAKDCGFEVFYGKLKTAPMINQCPLNMECSLMHILSSSSHVIVIGRIEASYVSGEYVKEGKLNLGDMNPLLWIPNKGDYVGVGNSVGKCRVIGKEIKT